MVFVLKPQIMSIHILSHLKSHIQFNYLSSCKICSSLQNHYNYLANDNALHIVITALIVAWNAFYGTVFNYYTLRASKNVWLMYVSILWIAHEYNKVKYVWKPNKMSKYRIWMICIKSRGARYIQSGFDIVSVFL